MYVKTTMHCHLTQIKMATVKKDIKEQVLAGSWCKGEPYIL
jgi:hypothetical protein